MSTRDTFRHAAIYSAASLLAKMAGFIMLPFYAHLLKGAGYGVIGMLDAANSFLLSLFSVGINGGLVRFFHEQDNERDRGRVISTGLAILWMVNLSAVTLLAIFCRPVSSLLLGTPEYAPEVILALLAFILDLTGQASGTWLVIKRRSKIFSGISLMRLAVGLSLNIYLIVIQEMGLRGYFLSSAITALLGSAVFHFIALRNCGLGFDRRIASDLLRFQVPLIPGNVVSFISRQVERVLLRFMINIESVGILGMGGRFPSLIPMLITQPFMRSWNTRRVEIAEQPGAPFEIGRMYTNFMLLASFAALVLAVDVDLLIRIMTPPEFWPASRIARIEIVTLIFSGSYYHLMFGLYYTKRTHEISRIRVITSLLKIAASWFLIHQWGIYGAAWSACFVWALTAVWAGFRAQRVYPIRIEYGRLAAIILTALAIDRALAISDPGGWGFSLWIENSAIPAFLSLVEATPLGAYKNGRILVVLAEKSPLIALLAVKTLLSCSFLLIFPFFHAGIRNKLFRRANP